MKLTREGIRDRAAWQAAGFELPEYDVEAAAALAVSAPKWVHFGIGNIFRIFIGGIADALMNAGLLDRGITCVEAFDYDVVEKIYKPYDNLSISVILHGDGTTDKRVIGSLAEAIEAKFTDPASRKRLRDVFNSPSLQLVSFTITEKGYALRGTDGEYFPFVKNDIANGPDLPVGAMGIITSLLLSRFRHGGTPIALVSMDNCSRNGERLRGAVLEMAQAWKDAGYVQDKFLDWLQDEEMVTFPWTMIDKITPRPSDKVARMLTDLGVEDMQPVITSKQTYIAPFVNAEGPQYLVVEDHFPNGRPPLREAGVFMTDRETVNKSERMKVTACLNPIHTALGPYGCVLGYELFPDEMRDPLMLKLAHQVGTVEGMPVVEDPGILSPQAFLDECLNERFPNVYLGDTTQRLSVDVSQGLSIRFGETIKAYVAREGSASKLVGIPLAIAGWLRYLLAVDDEGKPYELAPDPMLDEMKAKLAGVVVGDPASADGRLKDILSNEILFGSDLYAAGIGEKIEAMFAEELAGPGAVRRTIEKWLERAQ